MLSSASPDWPGWALLALAAGMYRDVGASPHEILAGVGNRIPTKQRFVPSKIFEIPVPLSLFASHLAWLGKTSWFRYKQGKIGDRPMLGTG